LLTQRWLRVQNTLLLVASYIFYGWWDWRFLGLIALTTVVDFAMSNLIHTSNDALRRKAFLVFSIVFNLGILGFFKYFNFFEDSAVSLLKMFGMQPDFFTLKILLPVGISFYTFQSMSYTIDVYRGALKPTRNLFDYALFVSFFPQLVAGPIERVPHLLPQVTGKRTITWEGINSGLALLVWGFFKKVVIADMVGLIADEIFNGYDDLHGIVILIGMLAFTVQIYADFSAYSDIARGLSKMMGFDLMVNFRLPYFARNPADFWRRWHISLSSWIRDYLYIPLGGNRGGKWKTYRNIFVAMALSGLWHGAAWNFVLWGVYHGAPQVGHRAWLDRFPPPKDRPPGGWQSNALVVAQVAGMFTLTVIGWVLFRSRSMDQIVGMFTHLGFGVTDQALDLGYQLAYFTLPLVVVQVFQLAKNELHLFEGIRAPAQVAVYTYLIVMSLAFALRAPSEFIYFQF